MTTTLPPLAIYAAPDQARASVALQGLGNVPSIAVQLTALGQTVQSVNGLQSQIDGSDPIILLVSSNSASSALFQNIAVYCQNQSKRLIVIDLDEAGTANVVGNLKNFGDTIISASDPELEKILEAPDRWTLPTGEAYPETGIKHQKKC